jgi:hypothetical protein
MGEYEEISNRAIIAMYKKGYPLMRIANSSYTNERYAADIIAAYERGEKIEGLETQKPEVKKERKASNPKRSKPEVKKERKASKGQGISYLEKYLSNRGIATDLIDLDALYDTMLTYEENKENVLKQIGVAQDMSELDFLMQQIDAIQDQRSSQSVEMDNAKRAKRTYNIQNIAGLREWTKKPNRVDVEGVDAWTIVVKKGGKK